MKKSNEVETSIRECESCGDDFEAKRRKHLSSATWTSYCDKCRKTHFMRRR